MTGKFLCLGAFSLRVAAWVVANRYPEPKESVP